jgi:succinyl-CoA synthetase alpha subunit
MKEFKIFKNIYVDSVTLMSATSRIKAHESPQELVMLMATPMNIELVQSVGFEDSSLGTAGPSDLMIGIIHNENEAMMDRVFDQLIDDPSRAKSSKKTASFQRIEEVDNTFNMAVISVAGTYAAYEAQKALEQNMHVMMFSDNVSVEDEIRLKKYAIQKDLLMMGPDCGTAIINGVGLCFANQLRKGPISLVAASGTGLQEVTVLIDQLGGGVRQAIGVGGRDLSEAVGGLMMNASLKAIQADPETSIVVVVSKPPAPRVEESIRATLLAMNKHVVVCFLDSKRTGQEANLTYVSTLAEAAIAAVELLGLQADNITDIRPEDAAWVDKQRELLKGNKGYLKGLYCGGTLTAESLSLLRESLPKVTSNVAKKESEKMSDARLSQGHNLVDLGDDVFTDGRPHPMIEPSIRLARILSEARLKETAAILLDFELGYGSHDDPVGITIPAIQEAQSIAQAQGRHIAFVGYVLGTEGDKQQKALAEEKLRKAGVYVARTNAHAANIAAAIVGE